MSEYFSHIPLLAAAIKETSGPVLELGAGYGSTLMLHGLCGAMERELVTIESDRKWMDNFINYGREWHKFKFVESFEDLSEYQKKWGLAFVDHGISEQRGTSIERLRSTPIIIAHDTCHPHLYNHEPVLSSFKYRWDWKIKQPQTTAVSDVIDVRNLFSRMGL